MVDIYYDVKHGLLKNKLDITVKKELEKAEADILSLKINELESVNDFSLNEEYFRYIHKYLFEEIYSFAGKYREINIEKAEEVLGGLSVKYEDYESLKTAVTKILAKVKNVNVSELENKTEFIADSMISLWQVHPFREGNTRTVIIFICKYLEANGIKLNNDVFKEDAIYVRKALVAASFEDEEIDVYANKSYILEIIQDSLES